MHLYRSTPSTVNYKFPDASFTLKNSDNDSLIRINIALTITIPLDLKPDFYCQIKVFTGVSVRVEYEPGVNIEAQEGFFIEGGQTFTIMGNGLSDVDNAFEIIRNRPVDVAKWTKLKKAITAYYGSRNFKIDGAAVRLMDGTRLLGEYDEAHVFTQTELSEANGGLPVEFWYSSNKILGGTTSQSQESEVYFQNLDFSENTIANTPYFHFYGTKVITGTSLVPSFFKMKSTNGDQYDHSVVLQNFNGMELDLASTLNTLGNDFDYTVTMPNIEVLKWGTICLGKNVQGINLINCPKLNKFTSVYTTDAFAPQFITIENCPLITHFEYYNGAAYWGTGPASRGLSLINVDNVFAVLNANGLLNGYVRFSQDFVVTAASDADRANMIANGWTIDIGNL